MDRFIDRKVQQSSSYVYILKSNMDRFIVISSERNSRDYKHLKSNMDRFIAERFEIGNPLIRFKIQYG